jgi:hypothetical protein
MNSWVIQTKHQQRNPELNDTIDQMDLTDVYRVFHPATTQYLKAQEQNDIKKEKLKSQELCQFV